MVATDRVKEIFADALEMLARGKVRNAAERTPESAQGILLLYRPRTTWSA